MLRIMGLIALVGVLSAVVVVAAGGTTGGVFGDSAVAPEFTATPPARTAVTTEIDEAGYTITRYTVIPGETVILRFTSNHMQSCEFNARIGPASGSWRTPATIAVNYEIADTGNWQGVRDGMAARCGEAWTNWS